MEFPQRDTDRDDPRGILHHLGGRWVWITIGLLAVVALSVRWLVEPGTSSTTAEPTVTTVVATTSTTTSVPPTEPSTAPVTDAPTLTGVWTMPDVVGEHLAAAKRQIVDLTDGRVDDAVGVRDASGDGRRQIIHENWTVCSQEPSPGAKFTPESGVTLSVVKNGESCPNESAATTGASSDHPAD